MTQALLGALPEDFHLRWQLWYPEAPPVGFLLRHAYPERCLRIHSLPESKRYPTSGPEYAELLRRHNAVATEVLGDGSMCAIVLFAECEGRWASGLGKTSTLTEGELPNLGPLPSELWDSDEGVFDVPVCLFGGSVTWQGGALDGFISAAAEDKVKGVLAELEHGRVYAPYDGGADLLFISETERNLARARFAPWLAPFLEDV